MWRTQPSGERAMKSRSSTGGRKTASLVSAAMIDRFRPGAVGHGAQLHGGRHAEISRALGTDFAPPVYTTRGNGTQTGSWGIRSRSRQTSGSRREGIRRGDVPVGARHRCPPPPRSRPNPRGIPKVRPHAQGNSPNGRTEWRSPRTAGDPSTNCFHDPQGIPTTSATPRFGQRGDRRR